MNNHMILFIFRFRRDYLKALHIDPLCLSARVNLGYNLQVRSWTKLSWAASFFIYWDLTVFDGAFCGIHKEGWEKDEQMFSPAEENCALQASD